MPIKQGFSLLKLSLVLLGLIGVSLAYLPKVEKQVIAAERSKKARRSDDEQKIILSKAVNKVSKSIEYEAPQTVLNSNEMKEEIKSSQPTEVIPETSEPQTPVTPTPSLLETAIPNVSVWAETQYSHTEDGHFEGQYYTISSSVETTKNLTGMTVSGVVSRSNIGLEKGSIFLDYVMNFDTNGCYISGDVTSSGYVVANIALMPGQSYIGQSVNFLITTSGRAGSGSLVYPIVAYLDMK